MASLQDESHPLLSPTSSSPQTLYRLPIKDRPPHGKRSSLVLFPLVFVCSCLTHVAFQSVLFPLLVVGVVEDWVRARLRALGRWIGFGRAGNERTKGFVTTVYDIGVGWTKNYIGGLLVLFTVWFAPTDFTITVDKSMDLNKLVVKDQEGGFVGLALPENLVIMANHQAYLDWIYVWILGYFSVSPRLLEEPNGCGCDKGMVNAGEEVEGEEAGPRAATSGSISHGTSSSTSTLLDHDFSPPSSPCLDSGRRYRPIGHRDPKRCLNRGHGSRALIILLKRSLKWIPVIGWGMQFYRFIFLDRSWATDRSSLTLALESLGKDARARYDMSEGGLSDSTSVKGGVANGDAREKTMKRGPRYRQKTGNGLWLLVFPEGTITSDEERIKSVRYAEREGVPDFVNLLHPRATGILFCLRTLLPQVPDLKLLDVTIGYEGVNRGGYAQMWYNLASVFLRGVPPPTIHIHLSLIDPRTTSIPGIGIPPTFPSSTGSSIDTPQTDTYEPLASEEEAKEFNLWLRGRWQVKEDMLDRFYEAEEGSEGKVLVDEEEEERGGVMRVPIGWR